jgi:hypothetical protein
MNYQPNDLGLSQRTGSVLAMFGWDGTDYLGERLPWIFRNQ